MIKIETIEQIEEAIESGKTTEYMQPYAKRPTEHMQVQLNWVENRGDFWYVGYKGLSPNAGLFGCSRIYKTEEDREAHPFAGTFFHND